MPTRYQVADFEEANELFHANGWTDGLPIVPPTPERVAEFLAVAGLGPDEQIGFYPERRVPVRAEALAINAVMAGCRPEYFPVVVAIIDGMLDPSFPIHVPNSSTGSFTLGFIVNGPVRRQLGMNSRGNVLGPGNRANSTIGRAVRLIQMNVLGSVPGAGDEHPPHGRPVLDRSMMGQPAKYAGYHIVEDEEAFPSLTPLHVELGYAPDESTVTLLMVAGYQWICAHGEQTPEAWIDTMAHYAVHSGHLHEGGYSVLLLPPENAGLFVRAGWTKADIRAALYERTRRSVAWLKRNGWKVQWQRQRCEEVLPGDDERVVAMAGSDAPGELIVVVCGGPAGSWPYHLYGAGGAARAITRRIRTARATGLLPAVEAALEPMRGTLAADGYTLDLSESADGSLVARIEAGEQACPDCLVPKAMMAGHIERALRPVVPGALPKITLVYPADTGN